MRGVATYTYNSAFDFGSLTPVNSNVLIHSGTARKRDTPSVPDIAHTSRSTFINILNVRFTSPPMTHSHSDMDLRSLAANAPTVGLRTQS